MRAVRLTDRFWYVVSRAVRREVVGRLNPQGARLVRVETRRGPESALPLMAAASGGLCCLSSLVKSSDKCNA